MRTTNKRLNRIQRLDQHKQNILYHQSGKGLYLYKNNNRFASLQLPKAATNEDGEKITTVEANSQFIGDDYFMGLVRSNECRLIKTLEEPENIQPKKEEIMPEEKLILDQPDTHTTEGKVEHVVKKKPEVKLNENKPVQKEEKEHTDVLLTGDAIDGIEILN